MPNWEPEFLSRSPLFEPLRGLGADGLSAAALHAADWPGLAELQALIDTRGAVSGGGRTLRLVAPDARAGAFEDRYEVRIYREGELQLRARNWHDLFNLLAWIAFPRAKAALNARHYQALLDQQARGAPNRGAAQDALTLFDESGMIVAASEADLLQYVSDFEWQRLFWQNRERVKNRMCWFILGHALYEKALRPYVGITGHGVLLRVDHGFAELPRARQRVVIDECLALRIVNKDFFQATRELAPVPLLGVPGWWPANNDAAFYANAAYFRPGRRRDANTPADTP